MRQVAAALHSEDAEAAECCLPGLVYPSGGREGAQKVNCPCSCRNRAGPFSPDPLGFIVPNLNCLLLCWARNVCAWC